MNFDITGDTSATLSIGDREIELEGKFESGGNLANIIELSYQSKSLADAVYLGDFAELLTNFLDKTLKIDWNTSFSDIGNILASLPDTLPDSVKDYIGKIKAVIKIVNGIKAATDKSTYFSEAAFKGLLSELVTSNHNKAIQCYLRGIILRISKKAGTPSTASLWICFKFDEISIFNIKLLSAGIKFSVTLTE